MAIPPTVETFPVAFSCNGLPAVVAYGAAMPNVCYITDMMGNIMVGVSGDLVDIIDSRVIPIFAHGNLRGGAMGWHGLGCSVLPPSYQVG